MTSSASTHSDATIIAPDAIQRVLFIASAVRIYQIPPLTSNKGYLAAQWTAPNSGAREIFTARLRIIETAIPQENESEALSTDILLEDPQTGELFAKAPYGDAKAVESVLDSSRFFTIRVVGPTGEKAVLGIGYEERGEAIDFAGALQEARKVLGLEPRAAGKGVGAKAPEVKKDYGLKQGETIKVDLDNVKRARRKADDERSKESDPSGEEAALFSIKPPPAPASSGDDGGGSVLPLLAPPPSAQEARAEKRRSRGFDPVQVKETSTSDLGFDDGEFGEFQ
ncbi:hypothetical protein ACLMJK_003494 [Lecanora helva]